MMAEPSSGQSCGPVLRPSGHVAQLFLGERRSHRRHGRGQVIVRHRIDSIELRRGPRDSPFRIDDNYRPGFGHSVVSLADAEGHRSAVVVVTTEEDREIGVRGP